MNDAEFKAALSEMARRGGRAGRGKAKARQGTSEYARNWWRSDASLPYRSKKPRKQPKPQSAGATQNVLETPTGN